MNDVPENKEGLQPEHSGEQDLCFRETLDLIREYAQNIICEEHSFTQFHQMILYLGMKIEKPEELEFDDNIIAIEQNLHFPVKVVINILDNFSMSYLHESSNTSEIRVLSCILLSQIWLTIFISEYINTGITNVRNKKLFQALSTRQETKETGSTHELITKTITELEVIDEFFTNIIRINKKLGLDMVVQEAVLEYHKKLQVRNEKSSEQGIFEFIYVEFPDIEPNSDKHEMLVRALRNKPYIDELTLRVEILKRANLKIMEILVKVLKKLQE